ncbi:hypothetical protein LA080_014387 [Diaporthe eres]|nr:hypothetical protein LA080_014387 [Diaporthe eres]
MKDTPPTLEEATPTTVPSLIHHEASPRQRGRRHSSAHSAGALSGVTPSTHPAHRKWWGAAPDWPASRATMPCSTSRSARCAARSSSEATSVRVVEGVSVEELFEDAGSRVPDRSTEFGRSKGREIDEIPLCGPCVEEVSSETAEDDHLIPMALRRIDRYDGGLSRRRWEGVTRKSTHEDHGHETPSSLTSHPELEHQTRIVGTSSGSKGKHVSRTPSPIYVSMHDPVGEPAFRRSETKPIPKWMQYLPSKRSEEWDCIERPSSVLNDYFSPPDSSVAESDTESSLRQSLSPPPVPAHIVPVRSSVSQTSEERSNSTEQLAVPNPSVSPPRSGPVLVSEPTRTAPPFKTVQMSRPFTFIDEKPGQRPSSRFQPGSPSPSRHVRFISPPKTTSSPTFPSGSVSHTKSPSESSEYLDRHVPQASQGKPTILLSSGLRDTNFANSMVEETERPTMVRIDAPGV